MQLTSRDQSISSHASSRHYPIRHRSVLCSYPAHEYSQAENRCAFSRIQADQDQIALQSSRRAAEYIEAKEEPGRQVEASDAFEDEVAWC